MAKATLRGFPITFSVTVGALLTQSPLVFVVLLVTGETVFGGLLEHAAQVTTLTFDFGMFAEQGEAALIVVEFGRFLPVALVVATCTVLAQGLFVFIILLVAGIALLTELDPLVELARMATDALGAAVLAA